MIFFTRFFALGFLSLLLTLTSSAAEPDDIDLSLSHYPMIHVNVSETEAHFNILVSRNKNYAFRARPLGNGSAAAISGEIVEGPFQDKQGLLHHKVLKLKISGLAAATPYDLEILEVSNHGSEVVDRRTFSTFDDSRTELRFATGSCMSDEIRFEHARQGITANMLRQNPDVIVLSGDEVYVDSFDYVTRNRATELDVWMRYFRSFEVNPLFRSKRLVPVLSTWDDHDTGVDNGNSLTPTIADARRAFLSLFGDVGNIGNDNGDISTRNIYRIVTIRGQHFVLLDNRSFRSNSDPNDRYGHLGKEQEEWLLEQVRTKTGFFWLVSGDMWGSETILMHRDDGSTKRLTEGFFGDHPAQYTALMAKLNEVGAPYGLISGDIHLSQVIEHGPQHRGTPRYAPFPTVELTSSPMFSIIFDSQPGTPAFWHDPQRITGVKDYNFIGVRSQVTANGVDFDASAIGSSGNTYFSYGTRINSKPTYRSRRRRLLVRDRYLPRINGKVKVAFFDADSTLRIAASGGLSANGPRDVLILPNVADRIAALVEQGYVIVIVSNQGGISETHVSFEGDNSYEGKFRIADQALQYTIQQIQSQNPKARIHAYDFAERKKGDFYTKPNIGMGKHFERILATRGLAVDWSQSLMVGDSQYTKDEFTPAGIRGDAFSNADRKFAENLGIRHIHPQDFFGWTDAQRRAIINHDPKALAEALGCAVALN